MKQPPMASRRRDIPRSDPEMFPLFDTLRVAMPLVHRAVSDAPREKDEARILAKVAREQLDPHFDRWRAALDGKAPQTVAPATLASGLTAIRRDREVLREAAHFAATLFRPMPTLEATLPPGITILAPRYDRLWTSLNGSSSVSGYSGFENPAEHPLFTGRVGAIVAQSMYTLQGLGMYVSVTAPSLVAITPMGTYQAGISGFLGAPSLRSTAGLGALVYQGASPTPVVSRIVEVWRIAGLGHKESVQVDGTIRDAASPAFGFGPVPLANPMLAHMQPGITYTIWFWCWIRTAIAANEYTLGAITMHLPFVVVTAGPPPIIK
jgi:hypothetical protein